MIHGDTSLMNGDTMVHHKTTSDSELQKSLMAIHRTAKTNNTVLTGGTIFVRCYPPSSIIGSLVDRQGKGWAQDKIPAGCWLYLPIQY